MQGAARFACLRQLLAGAKRETKAKLIYPKPCQDLSTSLSFFQSFHILSKDSVGLYPPLLTLRTADSEALDLISMSTALLV